jgi:hypothetical protein
MKKKSTQVAPSITLSDTAQMANYTSRHHHHKKQFKRPEPPSEETVLRLNALVKEAPFCFYYQERGNDFL